MLSREPASSKNFLETFSCRSLCHVLFKALYVIGILHFFLKDFIYLFDREKSQVDGEAGRERERETGSLLSREPDVGLDPRTLRS